MIPADEAVRLVCALLRERGMASPGRVRLTKLLYLLDVEMVRAFGERATPFEWVFYLYGPYALELEDVLTRAGLQTEERELADGRLFKTLKVAEQAHEYASSSDTRVAGLARGLAHKWGDANLNHLLDHVYFETEPMLNAQRGEVLRFDAIEPLPARPVEWKPDRKASAKLQALRDSLGARLPPPLRPAAETASARGLPDELLAWAADEGNFDSIADGGDVDLEPQSRGKTDA